MHLELVRFVASYSCYWGYFYDFNFKVAVRYLFIVNPLYVQILGTAPLQGDDLSHIAPRWQNTGWGLPTSSQGLYTFFA